MSKKLVLLAVLIVSFALAASAQAGTINSLYQVWGGSSDGNVPTGFGDGPTSREMTVLNGNFIIGGVGRDGVELGAITPSGSNDNTVFQTGNDLLLAAWPGEPFTSDLTVPVFDTTTVTTAGFPAGRSVVAAAWADDTPGVIHVKLIDGQAGETGGPAFAIATLDVIVGGNAPPVPIGLRFDGTDGRFLLAAQAVQVNGEVTSSAWTVSTVASTISPGPATQIHLDPAYGTSGIARGPFTADGGSLQAMDLTGGGNAVLTGRGDFTGADMSPTRLHILELAPTGQPDLTFGTNGLVVTDALADGDAQPSAPPLESQSGNDIEVTPTGDILITGSQGEVGQSFLLRRTPSGQPRENFGNGGSVVIDWGNTQEIALQQDGTIYVLGSTATDEVSEKMFVFDAFGAPVDSYAFSYLDGVECVYDASAMVLQPADQFDGLVVLGSCQGNGSHVIQILDELPIRRVRVNVTPGTANVSGTSVPLDEAARPDPASAAQVEVGGTIAAAPLRSSPLRSSPLRSSPLRSSPLRSSPLRSSPLRSSPLRSSPLTNLPLRSSGGWRAVLQSTPLRSSPLASITLGDVLDLDPIPTIALGDLDPTGLALRRTSVAALLLLGRPLDALPAPSGAGWCDFLASAGPKPHCGDPSVDPAEIDALDLELLGADLGAYWHSRPIPLTSGVIGTGGERAPLGDVPLDSMDLAATPLGAIPQSAVADVVSCESSCGGTLGERQAADPTAFHDVALADLLAQEEINGRLYTLQQVLPGIVPTDELSPEESAALDALIQRAASNGGRQAVGVTFVYSCVGEGTESPVVTVDSRGLSYVPGSGTVHVGSSTWTLVDPVVSGTTLTFTSMRQGNGPVELLTKVCDAFAPGDISGTVALDFDADPPTRLGTVKVSSNVEFQTLDSAGTPQYFDVVDGNDPPGDSSTTRVLAPDTLYTGYVPTQQDIDAYRIHAPAPGSVVTVSVSKPPADFDLFVQGPPAGIPVPPSRQRAATSSALADPALADQSADLNGDDETPSADGLVTGPIRASSLAALPLRGSSTRSGDADESVSFLVQDGDAGKDFLATVAGNAGATSNDAYGIRVTVTPPAPEPACIASRTGLSSGAGGTFPATVPATTQTLILWDRQRTEGAYAGTSAALATKLGNLAAAPGVNGLVVPVESDPAHGADVRAAFAAWDASPCSQGDANDVVTAINQVVDGLRPQLPKLRHVVIVGGDDLIPQARVPDLVGISNERQEADEVTANGFDTPISRALRRGEVLTDDPYGDFDPQAWLDGTLAIPDVALGRLVETPAEIGMQIDQYIARAGILPANSARVTGYDFVTDGAQSILGGLTTLLAGSGNIASRIDDTWTAADALAYINRTGGGITSINGHFDNYRALPAAVSAGTATDLLLAADADPASGSLFFTVGCHAGLQAIDAYAGGTGPGLTDWAQRLTRKGSEFVGNTGFGYGDTSSVAYSERLMAGFSSQLATRAVTAGQALMYAKQRYFATLGVPGVYDGKVLGEATFYGLPMYRVGETGGLGGSALPPADPSGSTNLQSSRFEVMPSLTELETNRGHYWTADGHDPIVSHFRPIQPRTDVDVTPTDTAVVHGALIDTLTSHDVSGVDPVYARPTVDLSANEPELATLDAAFPAVLQRLETFAAADGRHTTLNLAAGQFIANPGDVTGKGTQRLFTKIAGDVLRSHSTDFDPPRITNVNAALAGSFVTFTVTTPDADATGGIVLYLVPGSAGVWRTAQLVHSGDHFTAGGAIPAGTADIVAFAELTDGAGNVSIATDKVRGFSPELSSAQGDGAPSLSVVPAPAASGFYTAPVTVTIPDQSRGTAMISVDGGLAKQYSGPIHLAADGVHTVVAQAESGAVSTVVIVIDATPPAKPLLTATVPASPSSSTSPLVVGSAEAGTTVRLYPNAGCSGTPSATGTPADLAAGFPQTVPANSTTTFKATATDLAGNTSACSAPLVYVSTPPSPAVPLVTSTNPASPSNVATPAVRGTAAAGSTVRIYSTPACTGTPLAQGTAAVFNSTGIGVTVAQNTVTVLRATAAFGAGPASACSSTSVSYTHDNVAPSTHAPTVIYLLSRVYSGTATDNLSGIGGVQVTVTPLLGAARVVNATLGCTPDRRSCNWSVTLPIGGLVTLRAVATDAAGNRDPVGVTRVGVFVPVKVRESRTGVPCKSSPACAPRAAA